MNTPVNQNFNTSLLEVLDLIDQGSQAYWRFKRHNRRVDKVRLHSSCEALVNKIKRLQLPVNTATLSAIPGLVLRHRDLFIKYYSEIFNESQKHDTQGFKQFISNLVLETKSSQVSGFKITPSFILLVTSFLFLSLAVPSAILLALFGGGISIFPQAALLVICIISWSLATVFFIAGFMLRNSYAPKDSALKLTGVGKEPPELSNGTLRRLSLKKPVAARPTPAPVLAENASDASATPPPRSISVPAQGWSPHPGSSLWSSPVRNASRTGSALAGMSAVPVGANLVSVVPSNSKS